MRIQKYLSQQKILSRREAEEYIRKGLIRLNGAIVKEMGVQMDPERDCVEVLRSTKNTVGAKITVAVNKPRGIVSSKMETEGETIFQILPQFAHLNTVGRLDKESEGLILLSNDGTVTNAVTGDKHLVEKEYEVSVRESVTQGKLRKMAAGLNLEDGPTLPAIAEQISPNSFALILKEGRKHQIRRMCAVLQLTVTHLKRIRIGNIYLGKLRSGEYRALTEKEIDELKGLSLAK